MPGPYKRKKYHFGDTHLKKGWRTKRRTKDLDQVATLYSNASQGYKLLYTNRVLFQIDNDLKPENTVKFTARAIELDKPGLGQFYCVHCA